MPNANHPGLERCLTATISKPGTGYQSTASPKHDRCCTIAVQHLDGQAILINATIKEVNGNLVFNAAKQQITQALHTSWYQRLIGKLLMSLIVGTAKIKHVQQTLSGNCFDFRLHSSSQILHSSPPQPPSHPRQQKASPPPPTIPHRVYLQDFAPDPLLTEALFNPHLHLRWAIYPSNVNNNLGSPIAEKDETLHHRPARFGKDVDGKSTSSTSIQHDDDSEEIIVVKRILDKTKVARLLILLLLLSPALGIGVGICAHNAEVGVAVSAGVFALASFVQGLVAWMLG